MTSNDQSLFTLEIWQEFYIRKIMRHMKITKSNKELDKYFHESSLEIYEKMDKPKYLVENFARWNDGAKDLFSYYCYEVPDHLSSKMNVIEDAEAVYNLIAKSNLSHILYDPEIKTNLEIEDLLREASSSSEKFYTEFKSFYHFNQLVGFSMVFVDALRLLYPDELLYKVVSAWMTNTTTKDFMKFIQYLDRWDELNMYPVDWAISILEEQTEPISDNIG